MKKVLLVLALVMTLGFSASAQFDGFITEGMDDGYRDEMSSTMPQLPHGRIGELYTDQPAPLGSGLLIMTALGGAYLLRKREK